MKSVIYARTSTKDQKLDIQIDALNELSKRMNYQLVDTIIDEGVSGGKLGMNREGMKRLLQMVNRKEIDVVLNWPGIFDHWFLLFKNNLKLLSIPDIAGFIYNGLK